MDAEAEATKDDDKLPSIKELEAEAAFLAAQWLCDPASLEIFTTWYTLGGAQHGISPMEAMQMPGWLRHDFTAILSILGKERSKRKRAERRSKAKK